MQWPVPAITKVLASVVAIVLTGALTVSATAADAPTPERRAELQYLLTQDCGSCHGLTLKGGLGPALTPEALAGKPAVYLQWTILHGRPGTAMPPWRSFVSEPEGLWLAERLLEGEYLR